MKLQEIIESSLKNRFSNYCLFSVLVTGRKFRITEQMKTLWKASSLKRNGGTTISHLVPSAERPGDQPNPKAMEEPLLCQRKLPTAFRFHGPLHFHPFCIFILLLISFLLNFQLFQRIVSFSPCYMHSLASLLRFLFCFYFQIHFTQIYFLALNTTFGF